MRCALRRGIRTIQGGRVFWRYSSQSLSSRRDELLAARKFEATVRFFDWCEDFFREAGTAPSLSDLQIFRILLGNAFPFFVDRGREATLEVLSRSRVASRFRPWFPLATTYLSACRILGFEPRTF
jgi:hypothetical protein